MNAAFTPGFELPEALPLLELCMQLNDFGQAGYEADTTGWTAIVPGAANVDAAQFGPWNNAWRLWKKDGAGDTYALVIRGTIGEAHSIIEDVIATSISACPVAVKAWNDGHLWFRLAETPKAEVHLGFAYGLSVLMFDAAGGILPTLKGLPAGARLYVTGHSQGAAIATLAHAFLHYAMRDPDDRYGLNRSGLTLKSYVFAQPKPGNWEFSLDFARIAGAGGMAHTIDNSLDWVPQVPLSLEFLDEPGEDLVNQFRGEHGGVLIHAAIAALRVAFNAMDAARDEISRLSEGATERKLQEWNAPVSQMNPAFKGPAPEHVPSAQSVNYALVGNSVPVFGSVDAGASLNDATYQHHLPVYRALMMAQLGGAGV